MDIASPQAASGRCKPMKLLTRVLVIDDDDSVSAAIQAILVGRRCETVVSSRAYAGIRALAKAMFDVVMLDIFMPGLNGLDAIEYIRCNSPTPIIAMSGFQLRTSSENVDYLALAEQRGATCSIRKPFQPTQLIDAIEQARNCGN